MAVVRKPGKVLTSARRPSRDQQTQRTLADSPGPAMRVLGEGLLAQKCAAELATLQTSPTFAMSLGAKELFHTNFLAFLLQTDGPELDAVRVRLREALHFPVLDGEQSTCIVWREKKHLDLVVVSLAAATTEPPLPGADADPAIASPEVSLRHVLVVEAKLKSIPDAEQLHRYDAMLKAGVKLQREEDGAAECVRVHIGKKPKKKDGAFIEQMKKVLLSTSGVAITEGWVPATWTAVADAITQGLVGVPPSTLASVLADYAGALDAVSKLVTGCRAVFEDFWAESETLIYRAMLEETRRQEFVSLRLKDLVSKVVYDAWLQRELSNLRDDDESGYELKPEPHLVYMNSNPGIGIEYSVPFDVAGGCIRLGVQIQDIEFRRYVATSKDFDGLEKLAVENPLLEKWLGGEVLGRKLEGRSQQRDENRASDLRSFNHKRFVFQLVRLGDGDTLSDVGGALHDALSDARRTARLLVKSGKHA